MHRFITGPAPEGYEVDHINRNPSDNRRENLRFLTRKANMRNTSRQNHMDWDTVKNKTDCLYARIRWRDDDGKEQRKRFSVTKLGLMGAHYEAMKFNDEFVKPLYIKKHSKEVSYPTQCTTSCRTQSPVCKKDIQTFGISTDSRNKPYDRTVSSKC